MANNQVSSAQKLTKAQKAVLKTLVYSNIFEFPLTAGEISTYLINKTPVSPNLIVKSANQLAVLGLVSKTKLRVGDNKIFYSLSSTKKQITRRISREKYANHKTNITRRVGGWLKLIPTIKAIYITGSLATNNTKKNDDIDIMIITSKNRLWLTRLITILFLDTLGVRRKPEHKSAKDVCNKICLNLLLSENNLSVNPSKRNLYVARELVQAKLLWDKDNLHQKFLSQNTWIINYLPHSPLVTYQKPKPKPQNHFFVLSHPLNFIENLAFWVQKTHMSKRRTKEIITDNAAFFHPKNTSQTIMTTYNQKLRQFGIS